MEKKISISTGCTDYLVSEVESLRRQNELLHVQMNVVNNFFGLIDRVGPKPSMGYSEDKLWQAKREIQQASTETVI